jgi:tetratricopeptide (TPR) repeat protein
MPSRKAKDGGHSAFTDHRIIRVPRQDGPPAAASKLTAWRPLPNPLATRNLGIASVLVGVRDQSSTHVNEGYRLLMEARKHYNDDPILLTNLATVLLRKGVIAEAAPLFEAAVELDPEYAAFHVNYAQALKELGHTSKAITHLETALELDPSLEAAYRTLGEIYAGSRQPDKLRATFERYLEFMPKSLAARAAFRASRH